jgi:TRAF-type zinc finger
MAARLNSIPIEKGCPIEDCPKNNSPTTYGELVEHLETACGRVEVVCPYERCRATFQRLDWENHYLACKEILIDCHDCGQLGIPRGSKAAHSCIQTLRAIIKDQSEELAA